MPESLEQLDLLLLTVKKARREQQDGIRNSGLRNIDLTLAAYVGEEVLRGKTSETSRRSESYKRADSLYRAICQELVGETLALREVIRERERRR